MFLFRTELFNIKVLLFYKADINAHLGYGHSPTFNVPLLIKKKNRKKKVLTNNSTGYRPQRTPPSKSTS